VRTYACIHVIVCVWVDVCIHLFVCARAHVLACARECSARRSNQGLPPGAIFACTHSICNHRVHTPCLQSLTLAHAQSHAHVHAQKQCLPPGAPSAAQACLHAAPMDLLLHARTAQQGLALGSYCARFGGGPGEAAAHSPEHARLRSCARAHTREHHACANTQDMHKRTQALRYARTRTRDAYHHVHPHAHLPLHVPAPPVPCPTDLGSGGGAAGGALLRRVRASRPLWHAACMSLRSAAAQMLPQGTGAGAQAPEACLHA